jgi:tRNA/rRNA methyltransferase
MRCHFILVNPARGENVGFAARALKVMGFDSLRIVGQDLQDSKAARKTGYGSHDILDQTGIFSDLEGALEDLDLNIGTTSTVRIKRYDNHSPTQISSILQSKQHTLENVGFVFGSEENGLSTKELGHCDLVSTIPLATDYPSLNLAQSVLIYAWELVKSEIPQIKTPSNPQLQGLLKEEMKKLLSQVKLDQKPVVWQRVMDRVMLLDDRDTKLAMTILRKLNP